MYFLMSEAGRSVAGAAISAAAAPGGTGYDAGVEQIV
jgi:hypothetical protein